MKQNLSPSHSKLLTKSRLMKLFKLVLVVALLYFLTAKGFLSVSATQRALGQWEKMSFVFFATLITVLLGVIRWQWLLQAQNIDLPWSRTFQLSLIGNFFNIALPGAVSGDFVKAFYIGKEIQGQRSRAFGSILFDRVAGLSALVLVSAGALTLGFDSFVHSPVFKAIRLLLLIAASCVVLFYGYLFLVKEKHDPVLSFFCFLENRFEKVASLTRIYKSLRHYHHHRIVVLKVLGISILIHLTVGFSCIQFANALGETHLSWLSIYLVVPLGLLVTAVPIGPAGVGTGNLAFMYFFKLIGSNRGADVFSLFAFFQILFSSFGGIVYFRFKTSHLSLPEINSFETETSSI